MEIFLEAAPLQRLPQVRLHHSQEADGDSPRGASMLKRIFPSTVLMLNELGKMGLEHICDYTVWRHLQRIDHVKWQEVQQTCRASSRKANRS